MAYDTDIVIVGGGLNGTTLALALARSGLDVTVVDRLAQDTRADAAFDGRSYALALSSQRMLQALGLWSDLEQHAQPMLEIKVTDGRAGEGAAFLGLHFDHAEIEEGPMGYMVEDRHLRQALLAAVTASDRVHHISGKTVTSQSSTLAGAQVSLDDGTTLHTRLIVGADGRQSDTATRAGIQRMGWKYPQTALVCAIAHDKPHNGIAHQFFMPAGPLAILPLKGNRSSIVWSERHALANQINALSDEHYLEVLRPRFGDFLGDISMAGKRFAYPLEMTMAKSLTAERLVLIGDAAHAMHPIAGQGLNAGMRDVAVLAHVISHAQQRGEDFASPQVLARYGDWRRFDNASLAMATDLFNRLFSNDNSLLRAARDFGMGVVNTLPGLRRSFIREAAGLNGDLPDLMRAS